MIETRALDGARLRKGAARQFAARLNSFAWACAR